MHIQAVQDMLNTVAAVVAILQRDILKVQDISHAEEMV